MPVPAAALGQQFTNQRAHERERHHEQQEIPCTPQRRIMHDGLLVVPKTPRNRRAVRRDAAWIGDNQYVASWSLARGLPLPRAQHSHVRKMRRLVRRIPQGGLVLTLRRGLANNAPAVHMESATGATTGDHGEQPGRVVKGRAYDTVSMVPSGRDEDG